MNTKTKTKTARTSAKGTNLAAAQATASKSKKDPTAQRPLTDKHKCAEIHIHPTRVDFFEAKATEPFSRIANGAPGSDAYETAVVAIKTVGLAGNKLRHFDAQGVEIQ